jgi:hypothetical protein
VDPELVDPEEPDPRGTACAKTDAGKPMAIANRRVGTMREDLVMIDLKGAQPGTFFNCTSSNFTAMHDPSN